MDDVLRPLLDALGFVAFVASAVVVYAAAIALLLFASFWVFDANDGISQLLLTFVPTIMWAGLGAAYGPVIGIIAAGAGLLLAYHLWATVPEGGRGIVWCLAFLLPTFLYFQLAL